MRRGIVFFATGIDGTVGGIASANRNVREAIRSMGARKGISLITHVLHEGLATDADMIAHGGNRLSFGLSILRALMRAHLVVFDHVHLARLIPFVPQFMRSRTVVFAHGSESSKRVDRSGVRAFRAAELVVANSNFTLRRMRESFDGFVGVACPLGLAPQFVLTCSPPVGSTRRPVLRAADGSQRELGARALLLVARMDASEREKGHRELISVLPEVVSRVPEAEVVFVGRGSDAAEVSRLASTSSVAHKIFLPGSVDNSLLTELFRGAYAYVMPSRQEGFGLVHLEAMNYALPCLGCKDDGAADVIVDGVTGRLVRQPIEESELAAAIVELLLDPGRARAMGLAGWHRLNDQFTAESYQTRISCALWPLLQ